MQDKLHRLVYYSRNRIAPETMATELESILATSRRNNAAAGVTGALMFNVGCFGQVLEGSRTNLEAVFARIQHDQRHGEVSLLTYEAINDRLFEQWSMGFVGRRPRDAEAYAAFGQASGFDPTKVTGDRLVQAVRDLAIEDEEARGRL